MKRITYPSVKKLFYMISVNALKDKIFSNIEYETYDMKTIYNFVEDEKREFKTLFMLEMYFWRSRA